MFTTHIRERDQGIISSLNIDMADNILPLKLWIADQLVCHPFVGRFLARAYKGFIPSRGFRIFTENRFITPAIKASLFWGLYEKPEIQFIRSFLRKDLDTIELGSSLGVTSCYIRQALQPTARLICVDANPHLIDLIRLNLENNHLQNFSVLNAAIDYSGAKEARLELGPRNTDCKLVRNQQSVDQYCQVPTTTLSQILGEYKIEDYTLVSDIEGAEAEIILKDKMSLRRCRQIIIEVHDVKLDGQDFTVDDLKRSIMTEHGFNLVAEYRRVFVFNK